jgi:SAM-dependent methyltransferase
VIRQYHDAILKARLISQMQKQAAENITPPVRLNLGAGDTEIEGYTPVDRRLGLEVYPLDYPDDSVDEIRASHVLEHFPHGEVKAVLTDWVRALKPGGRLRVAVPNFATIARAYLAGEGINAQGYIMGGQTNRDDYHHVIFDEVALREELRAAGLRNIKAWVSELHDCASLPISLNLEGTKPVPRAADLEKIYAVMSTPRLGFMDNFFCAIQSLVPLGIQLRKYTGAFWGACLTRSIDEALAEGAQWILTLDYDTIFNRDDVEDLIDICSRYPQIDALAPVQASRTRNVALFTIRDPANHKNLSEIRRETLDEEILRVSTAHFGLTLIKVEALLKTPRPWFQGHPDPDGGWGDGRIDDDIHFWKQFERAGCALYMANRVPVGHAELMIRWPDRNLQPIYQHPQDYFRDSKPEGVWR